MICRGQQGRRRQAFVRGDNQPPCATTIHPTMLDRVTKYHCLWELEVARANIQYSLAEVTVTHVTHREYRPVSKGLKQDSKA